MQYKEDWAQAQERLRAWWEGEVLDRPCLQIYAPRAGVSRAPLAGQDVSVERWWTDEDLFMERVLHRFETTYFGGEAFPVVNPNLGPDLFAAYLGAPLRFLDRNTNWVEHTLDDYDGMEQLSIDEDNRWWRLQLRLLERSMEEGVGRWLTGIPDTHAHGDALSALRGNARLCLDLYDRPDDVHRALRRLDQLLTQAYDRYFSIVQADVYGSSSGWLPTWCDGRTNVVQCDFIALLSPSMMAEHILPSIRHEVSLLDRAVYHVDGPGSLPHLDTLMAEPGIRAIQWVHGAGNEPMVRWMPLLKRIQAAGLGLHLTCTLEEVPVLLEELQPGGLLIAAGAPSEEVANDVLAQATRRPR